MIQGAVAAALVALAVLFLARKAWRRWRGQDCGCGGCPSTTKPYKAK